MAVKPDAIENREQDLQTQTRERKPTAKTADCEDPAEQLRRLRQKIRIGLNSDAPIDPRQNSPVTCRDCYQRGYMAAMKHLAAED